MQYRTTEEHWKEKEKELTTRLCQKVASFFQMGFDGAAQQMSSRGYLLLGTDVNLLNVEAALMEYSPEAFEL